MTKFGISHVADGKSRLRWIFIASLAGGLIGANALAVTVTLGSVKDATLISDQLPELALGAAYSIYSGRVGTQGNSTLRRGLMQFNFSSIPAGSTVTSVQLKLYMSASQTGTQTVNLQKSLLSWGEGASFAFGGGGAPAQTNDATWWNRFYPSQPWPTPGGSFSTTVSASKSIGGVGWYTWGSTTQLVADVQSWIDQPQSNFGWGVLGNEVTLQSVKRFDAKESGANNPQLIVMYSPPPANPADVNNDGRVDGIDLAIVLSAWGTSNGQADINDDQLVDGVDLALVLAAW